MAAFKMVEGLTWSGIAGANLVGQLNRFVTVNADKEIVLAGAGTVPIGTLFEEGPAGAAVSVQIGGVAKVVVNAGGTVTAGALVSVGNAGGAVASGATGQAGIALESGTAGKVVPVLLMPSAKS